MITCKECNGAVEVVDVVEGKRIYEKYKCAECGYEFYEIYKGGSGNVWK
jgi:hypothetical protein